MACPPPWPRQRIPGRPPDADDRFNSAFSPRRPMSPSKGNGPPSNISKTICATQTPRSWL